MLEQKNQSRLIPNSEYEGSRSTAKNTATVIRDQLPKAGLFAGHTWRIALEPFRLGPELASEFETLGRVLLQFNRAVNLLYRHSVAGKQPRWVAQWLDIGKPVDLVALQRTPAFKNDIPRVIRPDIILAEDTWYITELDAVPGGIGLTAWLNRTYSSLPTNGQIADLIGGADGMERGFLSMFPKAERIHIVISAEAETYKPEMEWLAAQINAIVGRELCQVHDTLYQQFAAGDAVYRFFELFDLENVKNARAIFNLAQSRSISLTPPPKPVFEEKMLFALLWNRNLRGFWRQELGTRFFEFLLEHVPYTWVMDPTPLPPHAAIPELNITDWQQLAEFSQRARSLIIKISGFSPLAWGARSVCLGSDMPRNAWADAVKRALDSFQTSPYVLQRFHKPKLVEIQWFDFDNDAVSNLTGRARVCPYYFVTGDGDAARIMLGGVLVTVCPANKKIIHGMSEAVLTPAAL